MRKVRSMSDNSIYDVDDLEGEIRETHMRLLNCLYVSGSAGETEPMIDLAISFLKSKFFELLSLERKVLDMIAEVNRDQYILIFLNED